MFAISLSRVSAIRGAVSGRLHPGLLRRSAFLPQSQVLSNPERSTPSSHPHRFSTDISASLKAGAKLENYPEYFKKVKASSGDSVSLSNFKGKSPVVLFFYPKAGTPGCTKQAQTFRDQFDELKKLGAEVFGISGDTLDEQKTFASAQNLPFPLLVDDDNELRKGFGIQADLFGALPGRQTIVIDIAGNCILAYNNQFSPESHASEAIKALMKA